MVVINRRKVLTTILAVGAMFSLTLTCRARDEHRNPAVEALLKPLGSANGPSVYTPDRDSMAYKQLVKQLRNANGRTLQLLMDEVTNVGVLEENQQFELSGSPAYRVYRLGEAFQVVGTNAAPLLDQLESEFLSGRSVYGSECGLLAIGQDGWSVLLRGLTNSDLRVQVAAAAIMGSAKGGTASLAFPYLSHFATNQSASTQLKRASVMSIIDMPVSAKKKIPILIEVAKNDKNVGLRAEAVKALGPLGVGDTSAREFLKEALKDKNHYVRLAASTAIKELGGNE